MAWFLKAFLPLLGLGILIVLISNADLVELKGHISQANMLYVAGSIFCYLAAISTRMAKWWIFSNVVTESRSRLDVFFPVYCFIHLLGNVTPIRSGEMAGPIVLKQYIGLNYSKGIALVMLETSVEGLIFCVGVITAVVYFSTMYSSLFVMPNEVLVLVSGVALVLLFFLVGVSRHKQNKSSIFVSKLVACLRRGLVERFLEKFRYAIREAILAVRIFGLRRVLCITIPLTVVSWIFDVLRVYLMLCALGTFHALDVVATFMVVALFSMVSMVPLGLGVAEAGWIFVLTSLGYDSAVVMSGMLLERGLMSLLLIIIAVSAVVRMSAFIRRDVHS